MIDLKKKHDSPTLAAEAVKPPEFYYPCVYVDNVDGLDSLEQGQTVKMNGRVKTVTKTDRDGKKSVSFELEVLEIEPKGKKPVSAKEKSDAQEIDEGLNEVDPEEESEGE